MNSNQLISSWYEELGTTIFTYIYMNTKDYHSAEDILQEVFLKAYKNYDTFKGHSSFKTWIFSIAQNTTIDYLRKKNILKHFMELTFNERDSSPLPEQIMQLNDDELHLHHALQTLKLDFRQVILLRKIKCFSTKETAEILGWSENRVKTNLKRGLVELKKQLIIGGFEYEGI
ncbi:RNA polymerase sigma factor [Viridibacillus sp. NPDC093762]|uniref:RNA polymerase sigma factor n=1 Tax=Viridibacillus sp. NPDC093762 TaxID=3390720 RepID=UPI003D04971F